MTPGNDFGETVDSDRIIATKDISSLIPRPGWKQCWGLLLTHW